MMYKPSDREIEILNKIAPWLILILKDGEPHKLKPDAPEEIKELYEKSFGNKLEQYYGE